MIVYRSLDGGADIVFTRLAYAADGMPGDTFCLWRVKFAADGMPADTFCCWLARFSGDDQVTGYGATMPAAAADLHRQRREVTS